MEWIKVSEKLPEEKIDVLLVIKYKYYPIIGYIKEGGWYASTDVIDCVRDGSMYENKLEQCLEITHWMPLPALPKED